MGYEYTFIFSLPLQMPQQEQLLYYLKANSSWHLMPARPAQIPYLVRYAYLASGPAAWDEDFLIEVSSQQVYLLLHTAPADQTARVLTWLEQGATALGLVGTLAEL
jgi:hypothetical protein